LAVLIKFLKKLEISHPILIVGEVNAVRVMGSDQPELVRKVGSLGKKACLEEKMGHVVGFHPKSRRSKKQIPSGSKMKFRSYGYELQKSRGPLLTFDVNRGNTIYG